ncbi:MAG: hypothetical protein ACREA9_18425, partial [Pyrinomonadaceae bacterium]
MRLLILLLLGLFLPGTAFAQTPLLTQPDAPGVTVSGLNWRKDVYIPALYEDPMNPNQEQADLKREQKAIRKANAVKVQQGQTPLPMPTREIMSAKKPTPAGPSVDYLYEAKIRNTGAKSIRLIVWEYLVFDIDTGAEVGRHRFTDDRKIRAGKSATLVGYSTTPA